MGHTTATTCFIVMKIENILYLGVKITFEYMVLSRELSVHTMMSGLSVSIVL